VFCIAIFITIVVANQSLRVFGLWILQSVWVTRFGYSWTFQLLLLYNFQCYHRIASSGGSTLGPEDTGPHLLARPPLFSLEFPVPQKTSPPLFYLFLFRHFALQTNNCPFQTRPAQLFATSAMYQLCMPCTFDVYVASPALHTETFGLQIVLHLN
jgi:hypothetical protein